MKAVASARSAMASAPGKLMLFGEHAVVYGKRSIVTAVEARTFAQVEQSESLTLQSPAFIGEINLEGEIPKEALFTTEAVKVFSKEFGTGKKYKITTENRFGTEMKGLGSSSASTVSIIKALDKLHSTNASNDQIFELAYKAVLQTQKSGSGFDVAAATYGGTLVYSISQPERLQMIDPGLIIAHTGISADTPSIVKIVSKKVIEDPKYYEDLFDEIELVVLNAVKAIEDKNWKLIGDLMLENHCLLKKMRAPSEELGVSSEIIEKLIQSAMDSGAYGAKLSGAGVGDCVIALAPPSKKQNVIDALKRERARIVDATICAQGAQ